MLGRKIVWHVSLVIGSGGVWASAPRSAVRVVIDSSWGGLSPVRKTGPGSLAPLSSVASGPVNGAVQTVVAGRLALAETQHAPVDHAVRATHAGRIVIPRSEIPPLRAGL